jgi:hypothetical protein
MINVKRVNRCGIVSLLFLSALAGLAQTGTGSTSSNVTGRTSDNTSAGGESKPALPWQFLARPMGVLDSATWKQVNTPLADCKNNPDKCSVPSRQLEQLFDITIGKELKRSLPAYVVIHVVAYGDKVSDDWYLYRSEKGKYGDPRWTYQKFTGQRIYGARSVFFLFVHTNVKAITQDHARQQIRNMVLMAHDKKIVREEAAEIEKRFASNPQLKTSLAKLPDPDTSAEELNALIEAALKSGSLTVPGTATEVHPFCEPTSGEHFQWVGDGEVSSTYLKVRYEAAVVRRTPANIENLRTILGLLFGAHAENLACINLAADDVLWGAGRIDKIGLSSDVSIAGYSVDNIDDVGKPVKEDERSQRQLGSLGSYNDEQLYWWDASIGIPVHKIKDLQYSDSNNTVTASQVDKQSAYAMFNVMLHPVDLSDPGNNKWPRILVGFPLASSPWDKLFAGGAVGLPLKPFKDFQFFAGATFLRTKQPATLAPGDAADPAQLQNDLRIKTTPKFTFGINVPVKSVIDRLK